MSIPEDLDAFFASNAARIQAELFDFLRIPSVSTRPEHREDVRSAAEWLAQSMRAAGLSAEVHSTAGHPVVLGEWRGAARRRADCPDLWPL